MIRAIAIDDEPVALDVIEIHAKQIPFLKLEASFLNAIEALKYIKEENIDLIFLDISMPDMSGLEFASLIKEQTMVVFTTAYSEHAVKGFELAATDYLLKPINFDRFLQACELAESRLNLIKNDVSERGESLFVKDGHNWVQIKLNDVLYVQAQDNYVSIIERDKQTLTRMTLNAFYSKVPEDQFLRTHKSYIVAKSKIDKVEKHQIFIGGFKIPLSKSYREGVFKILT